MTEQYLKPRHTLTGKNLLPLILDFKSSSLYIPVDSLARLKKDHPLSNYALDELANEFEKLTRETLKDALQLAGKEVNLENALQLMHQAILFATLIGGPKGFSLSAPEQGDLVSASSGQGGKQVSSGQHSVNPPVSTYASNFNDSGSSNSSDIDGRLKKMETVLTL